MNEKNNPKLFQFPQIYIVEASAGSGKTYTLAKRYIWLLLNPFFSNNREVGLNTILAITFTNKAASEMKERIVEFLKKIALNKFSDEKEKADILTYLCADEESARKRAFMIMDVLIRNYNFFQVETIDSFINSILYGCAFRLNLSSAFKTEKDYSEYLAYSLDKLIDRAQNEPAVKELFHGFIKQYIYLEHKSGWFPKHNILKIIIELFSKSNRYAGKFIHSDIDSETLILYKKELLKAMAELNKQLPTGTNKTFLNKLSVFLDENKDGLDVDDISDFFKREEPPLNKGIEAPGEVRGLWQKIRENISKLCEAEAASMFNCYIGIFDNVLNDLKTMTDTNDVLFLEALNKEAHSLFNEKNLGLPELYYRLAVRFRHFLLDEFQDTSLLQWKNLFIMVEELLSTGGSLFYVGDKKQAIYRFRGGEASLIDSVRQRFCGFNIISEVLNKNYRSTREIVDFNNRIFSKDNLERFLARLDEVKKSGMEMNTSDKEEIMKIFETSFQQPREDNQGGFVKIEHIDCKNKNERDLLVRDKLLAVVEDLRVRFSFKDIAFLVRKNEEVETLTSWFLEEKIPVESERTLNIKRNPYIKEIVSFLKFLNSPIDNLSFVSFLSGDIFLRASKLGGQEIKDFILSSHGKSKEKVYLYKEFRRRFPEIWEEFFEKFFKNVGFVPFYELVVSIFGKLDVFKGFGAYQGFFMKFLELIRGQEDERADIASFLEFFDTARDEELFVDVTDSDAVKILTIHKSKGLEFSAVIIPFLEMNIKPGTLVVDDGTDNPSLLYLKKKYADFSGFLAGMLRKEYLKSFIDELNSIYVAFTRPVREFYIFVPSRAEKGFNPAVLLLPENNFESGSKTICGKNNSKTEHLFQIELPVSEYKDWINLLKDEFIDESILLQRQKLLRGEILHYALSSMGNLHNRDVFEAVKQAVDKTRFQFPFTENFIEVEQNIKKLLDTGLLSGFFDVMDGEVYLEKEVIDRSGNSKRIDRLIVKPKEVIVIDYKSARETDNFYHEQVCGYMKIIEEIYPKRKVKGVLIYLDELSMEEVG